METQRRKLTFAKLVDSICQVNNDLAVQAGKAVNVSLTLRNWLIGYQIATYDMQGADRARYGDRLLDELSRKLDRLDVSNCNRRQLYRYLRFFKLYPQIVGTLSPQLKTLLSSPVVPIVGTLSPQLQLPPTKIITHLSYSQIERIVDLEDPLQRTFYEVECIRGNWSVRELERQIATLYYERSAYSKDKKKLGALVKSKAETLHPSMVVRDPYVFEFLGIKSKEVMAESDFEAGLLNKLQDFLLELGDGFCFEASQKKVLIGSKNYYVDLVFYHRVLKCHVLIELKVDQFRHEHLSQLNTYVSWFKKHAMSKGDNPPIGILLCTQKDHALAEYALADMKNSLFISKYQVELPKKETMVKFLQKQLKSFTK